MFADKIYLLLLIAAVPLFFLLSFFLKKRKKDLARFIDKANIPVLSNVSFKAYKIRNLCIVACVVFLIIALARPQYGEKETETERKSSEIVFALDVSKSMLAEDVRPNRITKARELVSRIISDNEGEKMGAIVFSAIAMWQCPMTYDTDSLKMFLQETGVGALPSGGTWFAPPIELAAKAVDKNSANKKVLIMITDGEDHDANTDAAVENAKDSGLKIICVGIGTAQGAPVPEKDGSGKTAGYVRGGDGKIVVSRLNPGLLKSIAERTGGKYFEISGATDITGQIVDEVKRLEKSSVGTVKENAKYDRFQIFIFAALLFLVLGLGYRKTKRAKV